jgi:hypothetical protein
LCTGLDIGGAGTRLGVCVEKRRDVWDICDDEFYDGAGGLCIFLLSTGISRGFWEIISG